ncbi:Nrap protein [Flammula alnicola]|nr:Nrap protein [Flammula alnicola]
MVQNLKRKREDISLPRKAQRVQRGDNVDIDNGEGSDAGSEGSGDMSEMEEGEYQQEWGGIEGAKEVFLAEGQHSGTKPKKPPTGEELRAIKDASDLFKSSSFKLQIDALLPNVRPKASRVPPLERFLFALHSFLKELPSIAPHHPLEAARKLLKKGIAVPYSLPLPTEETNWKVAFEPPSDITLVGSWANKISVKPQDGIKFGVDLAVEMPNSLFQEKDYLNGRFFHKRSFYLATIAAALQKSKAGLDVDVTYESLQGDPRLTKLVLKPKNNDSATDFTKLNAEVCILPVLSSDCPIPLQRLSPSHSNIRLNTAADTANEDNKPPIHLPTPFYNNALLRTLTPKSQILALHTLQNDCPAFSDALTLLRIWANQRGYSEGTRMCIHGFEGAGPWWWSVLALLLNGEERRSGATKANKRKSVGKGLSSYQLFKAALEFLAKHDFEKEPVFLRSAEGHRAVFVDSASLTNLLAGVPLLRYDAAKTLETLNQSSFSGDPFTGVFLKDNRNLLTRFDVILRYDVLGQSCICKTSITSVHSTIDVGSPSSALLASIALLCRAVTLLHPSSAHPSSPDVIFIGIVHNPLHAFRLVDHGPAAGEEDQTVLEKFRDLWGDKAELRRFKDGRIVESVVWDITTADERAHVPSMIEEEVETWQTSFDSLLRLPQSISREYLSSGVSTGFKGALTAFDNLVKSIKKLDEDLPLSLLTVSPISESLRYTSVFSPVPHPSSLAPLLPPNARYLAPIEIAVQTIKLAFFERIALTANVVIGDGTHDSLILDRASLEIVTPEGWAFSARIWHDREVNLLDRVIEGNATTLPHVYYEAMEAKEVYMRRFIHFPRHHRAIAALSHHYSAFSGTVRLVKRWLASHWLLHGHISEEVVELICASFFVDGGHTVSAETDTEKTIQHLVPASKERGFAYVVQFLKEWKWEEGLFVSTELDKEGHVWTYKGPDLVVARRVRALADATWNCLQEVEHGQLNVQAIFIHPTEDYDFLLQLDAASLPRYLHNVNVDLSLLTRRSKYANKAQEQEAVKILPGFDPARLFFNDLQLIYADTLKLFYDPFGEPRAFRVLGGFSSTPVKKENEKARDKGMVILNKDAVISEIERLGTGLIKKMTLVA